MKTITTTKILKIILVAVSAAILTSGCAVKHNDSVAEKTLKHTLNSPLYLILGAGAVATKAVEVAVLSSSIVAVKTGKATVKTIEKIGAIK